MIQDYLKKLHQLQLDTLDTPVNLTIDTNYDMERNYPWLSITVTIEGYHKSNFKFIPSELFYLHVQMYGDKEGEKRQKEAYARIEKFVKDKLQKFNQ